MEAILALEDGRVFRGRGSGAMRGVISMTDLDEASLVSKAKTSPSMVGLDLASRVSTGFRYDWNEPSPDVFQAEGRRERPAPRFRVAAYDYGIKHNILRRLVDVGCSVTVVPAAPPAS